MNTSAHTTHIHDTTTNTARATATGFLRRSMAGALLAAAITATALGLAATSQADTGARTPNTNSTSVATAPTPRMDGYGNAPGMGYPHKTHHCHGHCQ